MFIFVSNPDAMMMMKNVYLADDDIDDVELFQVALEEVCNSCTFTSSKDGADLLQKLGKGELPGVLFIDVNMPMMNGLECLAKIKQQDKLKDIPVVILTTSTSKTTIDKAYDLGASLFVEKPSDFGHLKKMIYEIVHFDWSAHIIENKNQFIYRAC